MHFLFEKKGGGIFGDHNLPSGDQKFILDCQLALVVNFGPCVLTALSKRWLNVYIYIIALHPGKKSNLFVCLLSNKVLTYT